MSTYPKLMSGDIVLVHGTSWSAKLIQFLTRSWWNHAAIIIDDVGKNNETDYILSEADRFGVRVNFLSRYENSPIAIYRDEKLASQQRELLAITAVQFEGEMYDYFIPVRAFRRLGPLQSFKLIFRLLSRTGKIDVPHVEDHFVVCSEMCQEVYNQIGEPLIDNKYLLFPGGPMGISGIAKMGRLSLIYRRVPEYLRNEELL